MAALKMNFEHRSIERRQEATSIRRHSRLLFSILLIATGSFLGFAYVPHADAAAGSAEEYRIKAAFIYHFMQLVDWPDENFADGPTIELCTVGEDKFRGELENAMNGKTVHARSIAIRHLSRDSDLGGCEAIFVDGDDRKLARHSIEDLKGRPILTIGDSDGFLQDGGMIRLLMEDNKIRFEINLNAAQKARLKISSRLLLLAKTVIGKPGA